MSTAVDTGEGGGGRYFILHNVPCSPLSVLSSHCVFSGAQQRAKYKLCGGWVPCLPLSV